MRKSVLLFFVLLAFCATGAQGAAPWSDDAVVYEIFVRSFNDSDGDGIGDFRGIEAKLDYIEELGATAIWLMPSFATTTYHGYDIVDYYAVNEEYGAMEDFESLLRAARARGIRVILDLVINHTSSENEWFKRSVARDPEYDDWYIWRDEPQPGKWIVYGTDELVEGGGWRYSEERALLELYRALLHQRKERSALRHGDYAFFDVGDGVLAFRRAHEGESVLVLMSLSEMPRGLPCGS